MSAMIPADLEHEQYVRNLEDLVTARTEQLRLAVVKIGELTAELELLKKTSSKSSQPEG
jgi:hypothetical protein